MADVYFGKVIKSKLARKNPDYVTPCGTGLLLAMPDGYCFIHALI